MIAQVAKRDKREKSQCKITLLLSKCKEHLKWLLRSAFVARDISFLRNIVTWFSFKCIRACSIIAPISIAILIPSRIPRKPVCVFPTRKIIRRFPYWRTSYVGGTRYNYFSSSLQSPLRAKKLFTRKLLRVKTSRQSRVNPAPEINAQSSIYLCRVGSTGETKKKRKHDVNKPVWYASRAITMWVLKWARI